MAVLSRSLTNIRPQADGTIMAREVITHSRGTIYHDIRAESEAAANTTMNARDMDPTLLDEERTAVVKFVRDGLGTPDDFVAFDLTVPGKRRAGLRHFATTRYKEDPVFHTNIAAWVGQSGAAWRNTIASILGVSTPRATTIRDRAAARVVTDGLNDLIVADDAAIDEDID